MKTSTYEGGHRVPCYFRWPDGGIRQGEDHDELTVVQDILPTLIELCNLNGGKAVETDGISLAGILKDRQTSVGDRKKVLQYRFQGKDGKWDNTVVMWNKWRLIGGDELYDLRTDVHQDHNVAEKFPDVVKEMTEFYDEWYREAGKLYERKRFITVGSEHSNPAILFANDWTGDYCDYVKQLYYAEDQGHFNIEVERPGEYEFRLSRWPFESNLALTSDDQDGFYSGYYFLSKVEESSAIPVAKAQLKIADKDLIIDTSPEDRYAEFNLHLNKGRYELTPNLLDKNGEILCSAMFIRVLRK
jgi:arylsulfatase